VKKTAEKPTQSKASTGFSRLFGNTSKKQPSTTSSGNVPGSSEVSQNTARSPVRSKSSPAASDNVNESTSSKTVSNSRMKVADASKPADKPCVLLACYLLSVVILLRQLCN